MSSIILYYFKDMSDSHETQGLDYQEILSSPEEGVHPTDTTDTTDTKSDPKEDKSEDLPEEQDSPKMKTEKMKTKKSEMSEMSEVSERPEKKKRPPRPRKDVLCEVCGKTYSSLTKSHKCCPPKGFVKAEKAEKAEVSPLEPKSPRPLAAKSPPLPPNITSRSGPSPEIALEDVRGFLAKAQEEKRASRRSTWISQLF